MISEPLYALRPAEVFRALARYETREIIATIKSRAAQHDLNRRQSLPYFDDRELAIVLESFEVIPRGGIMCVPTFVVRAARAEQSKVADDTRLSPGTCKYLIHWPILGDTV